MRSSEAAGTGAYNGEMAAKSNPKPKPQPLLTLAAHRRYARQIAKQFRPEKIILFGSYAYGEPHQDSDVDLLVVMPARDHHSQAVKIRLAITVPFPVDLLVRTPKRLRERLEIGD